MAEMETRLAGKIETCVGELRKEMASKRDARQQLQERILQLEAKHVNTNMRFAMRGRRQINDCDWRFRGGCPGRCRTDRA